MADPFEVRMRFTTQLQHLNASSTSSQKAAHFALKHPDMAEDLHSCILEQLERNSMNSRANIMFFIEVLCELSLAQRLGIAADGTFVFVEGIKRDIGRIVDCVTLVSEEDGGAAAVANGKVVRKVVGGLREKNALDESKYGEIMELLSNRDKESGQEEAVTTNGDAMPPPEQMETSPLLTTLEPQTATTASGSQSNLAGLALVGVASGSNTSTRFDKRLVEQRIEEDRERHKKLRESYWTVQPNENELARMWSEYGKLDEVDLMATEEALDEKRRTLLAS